MALNFRCEKCGKLLEIAPGGPSKIKCPYCNARVEVPEALASLPTPKVPAGAATVPPPPPPGGAPVEEHLEGGDLMANPMVAKLMPWLISAALHAGVLVVLMFTVAVVTADVAPLKIEPVAPSSDFSPDAPTNSLEAGPNIPGATRFAAQAVLPSGAGRGWSSANMNKAASGKDWGVGSEGASAIDAYGSGSGGGGGGTGKPGDFGMARGGGIGKGFFGAGGRGGGGGNAYYVIFTIDHSGSMMSNFDEVGVELKNSIFRLTDLQSFHVVFFAGDSADEATAKRLVQATEENKRQAVKYLDGVNAAGFGSSPIPALAAAFKAFKAVQDQRGKMLYMLTDGEFDTGSEAVIQWLRDNNKDKTVHVYPLIIGDKPDEKTEQVMQTIAKENGGEYKYVARRH
jgi:hypothetical protein